MSIKDTVFKIRIANQTAINCICDVLIDEKIEEKNKLSEIKNILFNLAVFTMEINHERK